MPSICVLEWPITESNRIKLILSSKVAPPWTETPQKTLLRYRQYKVSFIIITLYDTLSIFYIRLILPIYAFNIVSNGRICLFTIYGYASIPIFYDPRPCRQLTGFVYIIKSITTLRGYQTHDASMFRLIYPRDKHIYYYFHKRENVLIIDDHNINYHYQ